MLYGRSKQELVPNKQFIFDEVYRNALEKERVDDKEQFFYYKTLGKIRDRFRMKNRKISESVFERSEPRRAMSRESTRFHNNQSFNVEKIHNKMFKIHKSNIFEKLPSKPSSSLSGRNTQVLRFQEETPQIFELIRPKLE